MGLQRLESIALAARVEEYQKEIAFLRDKIKTYQVTITSMMESLSASENEKDDDYWENHNRNFEEHG